MLERERERDSVIGRERNIDHNDYDHHSDQKPDQSNKSLEE